VSTPALPRRADGSADAEGEGSGRRPFWLGLGFSILEEYDG
jgi:hypothetical protein